MATGDLELGDQRDLIQEKTQNLLDRVKNGANHRNRFSPTIYMAPSILRDVSPCSFNPRIVSIGPLHREDENVQAFGKQKETYLISLMNRIESSQEEILKSCMEKAYASMNKIKVCYAWTKEYDDAEIAEMMVMDACFMLEFMILGLNELYSGKPLQTKTISIMHDLVLLENQIPLFFLYEIFQCTVLKFSSSNLSLTELILPVLSCHNLFEGGIKTNSVCMNTADHILSLLHQCYKPQDDTESALLTSIIPSVIDLDRAGVNFKPNKDPTWALEMDVKSYRLPCFFEFWSKPTLTMPVLLIEDSTEMVLRNLIAYEQYCQTRDHITSYVFAIDTLVNTQEDVAKLIDSSVFVNYMGSNEEAANMINSVLKHVEVGGGFFYSAHWIMLIKYYNGYWPKNIAWLRRTYFNSPWNIIALFAGIILFSLTVVQTVFTIKSA